MCRRCGGEEETIEHLMRCKKNRNTAGRLLRALGEFGSSQDLESLVNLTMDDKEPDKTRALTIIAASLTEELMKGNGRVKWKGWLQKLEQVAEGQAGRSKTQMEVTLSFMRNLKEKEEEEEEEREETQEEMDKRRQSSKKNRSCWQGSSGR